MEHEDGVSEQLRFEDEEVSITLRRAWDRALRTLATRVNKPTFEAHIRAIRPVSLVEGTDNQKSVYIITLGVPSAFTREWVENRHGGLICGTLEEILDHDVRLRFSLLPREAANAREGRSGRAKAALPGLFDEDQDSMSPAAPAPDAPVSITLPDEMPSSRQAAPSRTGVVQEPAVKYAPEQTPGETGSPGGDDFALMPAPGRARKTAPSPADPVAARTSGAKNPSAASTTPAEPRSARETGRESSATDAPLLNPRYTFDNFVVGQSNRLAHAGARAVAQGPGAVYNPLFVYGPPGLGKTHLMHAIGNEIARGQGMDPSRVAYISGEAFTSNFIASLQNRNRAEEFRRKWRSVDLWLVDDIQFIAGKEQTKEEFFHTFNSLYQTGKQIVISSDRSPRELRMMDERLRSRFESGLIADIAPPDLETRLAILQRKADVERMRIPDDVLLYMAKLIQSNIRTLEGALVKLIAYASLQNSPVTTDLAASILERYFVSAGMGDMMANGADRAASDSLGGINSGFRNGMSGYETPRPRRESGYSGSSGGGFSGAARGVTVEMIQRAVARRFGMDPEALTGQKRDRDIVNARQIAMHLMRELTEMSLPSIGQMFGGRDHKTVSHSCERVKSQLPFDDDLRSLVEDLTTQIRAQASG
jgi:chromosomal replication initiator protein